MKSFLNGLDWDAGVQHVAVISFIPVFRELMLLECDKRLYVDPVGFPIDSMRWLLSCSVGFGAFFNICYLWRHFKLLL